MEEELAGGRTTPGVVRIGDTVRRPRDRRSGFAAQAVTVLNDLGLPWAPKYIGVDAEGRDTFAYIAGRTTDHPSQRDENSYRMMGAILAELHRSTRGLPIAAGGECLVHGDPGPFNVVMQDGLPVALIDWDSVHPGSASEDIGYGAWTWCIQSAGDVPVDDQARRLLAFRDGYDPGLAGGALLDAIRSSQQAIIDVESAIANDTGQREARRAHARDAVAWARADLQLVVANEQTFFAVLN